MKSSTDISINGFWTSPYPMRSNEISRCPVGLLDHGTDILVNSLLVEGIDDGGVRCAAIPSDLVGNLVKLCLGAAGEEDSGSLAGEGMSNGTADRTARTVDHGNLVLQ